MKRFVSREVCDALPGFVGLREFFRRLGDQFEPIALDDDQQDFYIKKIEELRGFPEDLFFNMKWAWRIDPHFREARRYPNGVTMVRIGVGMIVCGTGLARDTQNLLMAFDANDRLLHYTVLAGSGKLEKGVKVYTCRDAVGVAEEYDSFDAAERFVRTMDKDDFFVIEDVAFPRQYLQALAGMEGGKLVYAVEYCLENFVLHFTLPHHVDADGVLKLLSVLKNEGFASLQDAAAWKQLNVEGYWDSNGKDVEVDVGILAHIYRTEIVKGDDAAQEMREIFDLRTEDEKPLSVKVSYGSSEEMRAELFELAKDAKFTDGQRKRIALYIYMMLRDEQGLD